MTTFHDPPPHSRRAVRQSERGDAQARVQADQVPAEGPPYAFDAAQAAPVAPSAPDAPPPTGRRALQSPDQQRTAPTQPVQDGSSSAPGYEPLTYSTQGRLSPPVDDQQHHPQHQSLAAAPPPGSPDQAGYRVRDFSPEGGRRAAPTREPMMESPLAASASFPAPPRPVDLDYQTQAVAPAPTQSASLPVEDTMSHTLSRRELREMRAAAEQQAPPLQMPSAQFPESIGTLLNSGPIEIPTLAPPPGQSQALAEAMAEFDMLTRSRREAEARARDAQVASLASPIIPTQQQQPGVQQPSAPPPVAQVAVPLVSVPQDPSAQVSAAQASAPQASAPQVSSTQASAPQAPAPQIPDAAPHLLFPPASAVPSVPQVVQPVAPAPVPAPLPADAPELVEPVFLEPQLDSPQSAQDPGQDAHGGRSPRASNHWRVQAAIEDEDLPYESTLSRTVGSNTSAITTSALVLPSVPQPDAMLASLNATGEILVTGSINLPRSLGSTGAHPDRVDNSDYEDDPFDNQVAAPDSAPVRAIRAIASSTSTRGVIETKRPQGNRMLTVVIIVAAGLCVGLLGLLIFAFATGKL